MAAFVVDASVVVKWYIPEQDHETARTLRNGYLEGRHDLMAPALLPYEVVNGLKYSGHYKDERLTEAAASLPDYGIDLVPFHEGGSIASVAAETGVTIYDAAYLALADSSETSVYTADSRLVESLEGTEYAATVAHIRTYDR